MADQRLSQCFPLLDSKPNMKPNTEEEQGFAASLIMTRIKQGNV